jgi:hypothetical protein
MTENLSVGVEGRDAGWPEGSHVRLWKQCVCAPCGHIGAPNERSDCPWCAGGVNVMSMCSVQFRNGIDGFHKFHFHSRCDVKKLSQ